MNSLKVISDPADPIHQEGFLKVVLPKALFEDAKIKKIGQTGIRFTSDGMPFSSLTSSRASDSESLTPLSMTYSKVIFLALCNPG